MRLAVIVCAFGLVGGAGCAHRDVIPGTNVVDNEVNRAIVKTVEDYRQAIESRDVDRLLMLASDRYSEDWGRPRPRCPGARWAACPSRSSCRAAATPSVTPTSGR